MTVASTLNRKTYAGNGVTVAFATSPVVFYEDEDLVVNVTVDATGATEELVLGDDYSVTGGNGSAGTVTLLVTPATGETVVIRRVLDTVQEFDPENNDVSDADALEQALDKLTMMVQQLSNRFAYVVQRSEADITNVSYILPPGYGDVIGRDDDGNIISIDPDDLPLQQRAMSVRAVTASTYTLVEDDDQNIVNMVNGGAVSVPDTLTVGHMTGIVSGSGSVTVAGTGGASVVVAASYAASLNETNSFATVLLKSAHTWLLFGNLTLA